jgi:hypothetical protein
LATTILQASSFRIERIVQAIHDLVPDEKKLGRHYNTLEKLLAQPEIGKYVRWKRGRARTDEQGLREGRNGLP